MLSKIRTFFFASLLCAINVSLISEALANDVLPDITVPEPLYEFGTVSEGQEVVHEFLIRNDGGSVLDISRLVPSCGCTASAISKNALQPKEETKVRVTFNTQGFSGSKVKTVKLYTNDPDEPSTVLTLKGAIQKNIIIEPERLAFEHLIFGKGSEVTTIVVKGRPGSGVKIKRVRSYSPHLEVTEKKQADGSLHVSVRVSPEAPEGELRERIVLELRGAAYRAVNIPVYARIRSNFELEPRTLSFGVVPGSEKRARSVKLINREGRPIKVAIAPLKHKALKAELIEIEAGKTYLVKVHLNAALMSGDVKEAVSVKISGFAESDTGVESPIKELSFNVFAIAP